MHCSSSSRDPAVSHGVGAGGAELGAHPRGVQGGDGVWRGHAGPAHDGGAAAQRAQVCIPALCLLQGGHKRLCPGFTAKPPMSCGSEGGRRHPELCTAQPGTPDTLSQRGWREWSKTEQGSPSRMIHSHHQTPSHRLQSRTRQRNLLESKTQLWAPLILLHAVRK